MQQLRALYDKTADSTAQANLLLKLIQVRPADISLRVELAKELYVLGRPDQATKIINQTLGKTQLDKTRLDVIAMWMDTGLDEELIIRSIGRTRNPTEPLNLAGAEFALSCGKPMLALSMLGLKDFKIPVTPITADRLGAAALAQAMLGQEARAFELANRVLAVDKTQPKALAARGRASLSRGLVEPAIRDARLLIHDNPTSPDGYLLLSDAYILQGNPSASDRVFEDGKAAMVNSVEFVGYYSDRLIARHELADAAKLLRAFTIRNPSSMAAWKMRRTICAAVGDTACASRASLILQRLAGKAISFPPLPADEVQSDAALIDLT